MAIREILQTDIPAAIGLLEEGFPRKSRAYWQRAFQVLSARPRIGALPALGLALEIEGTLQGLMLTIASSRNGATFCNLSSWYVRPEFRRHAPFLLQRVLRDKDVTYTDCSPAEHVLPIVSKFGFRPYTCGTLLVDARAGLKPQPRVCALTEARLAEIDPRDRNRIARHLSHGCQGFLLPSDTGPAEPVLYRPQRLKRLVPAARFVAGRPRSIAAHAGSLSRALLRRGIPVMLIDRPCQDAPAIGRVYSGYGVRYAKGPETPPVGDLMDTEIGLFGL